MKEWIIYRTGHNAANQSARWGAPLTRPVATVRAASAEEAIDLVLRWVECYANQFLSARPAEEVAAEEALVDERVQLLGGEEAAPANYDA